VKLLPWEHGVTSKVVLKKKSMVFVIFVDFSSQLLVETLKAVRELFLADLLIDFILVGEIRDSQFPGAYIKFPAPFSYGHIESV
jgi:hypothetical protein